MSWRRRPDRSRLSNADKAAMYDDIMASWRALADASAKFTDVLNGAIDLINQRCAGQSVPPVGDDHAAG